MFPKTYRLERGDFSGASLRSPVPSRNRPNIQVRRTAEVRAVPGSETLPCRHRKHAGYTEHSLPARLSRYTPNKKKTHTHTHTRIITPSLASLHTRTRTTIGTTNEQMCPRPHSCFLLPGRPTAARHSPSWLRALLATSTLRRSANASLAMRSRSPVDKSISDCVAAQIKEKRTRGETSEITER